MAYEGQQVIPAIVRLGQRSMVPSQSPTGLIVISSPIGSTPYSEELAAAWNHTNQSATGKSDCLLQLWTLPLAAEPAQLLGMIRGMPWLSGGAALR